MALWLICLTKEFLKSLENLLNNFKKTLKKYVITKELSVALCRNAMTINGMVRHDIPSWVKVIPMASLEIYIKVQKGYVYLTN